MAALGNVELPAGPQRVLAPATVRAAPPHPALPRVIYALNLLPGHKFGSIEEQIVILSARFAEEGSLFLPLFICDPRAGNLDLFGAQGVSAERLDLRRFHW